MFVNNLVKSSMHSIVKESALFTLGGLAENNGKIQIFSFAMISKYL